MRDSYANNKHLLRRYSTDGTEDNCVSRSCVLLSWSKIMISIDHDTKFFKYILETTDISSEIHHL
jgi:hypothetical protein